MEPADRPRVKICCISSPSEARTAVKLGASALGLVSEMPSGPGVISEAQIGEIAADVPPGVAAFLLTSRTDPAAIIQQQRACRTNTIQLCDRLDGGGYRDLRRSLPGVGLVQVIHVTGWEALEQAMKMAEQVDALLLDSGNPALAVKELGGTGRVHDWEVSRRIREESPVPVWLAGGLSSGNVKQAFQAVRPFGLDLCTGVRTQGVLDPVKLRNFFDAVETCRPSGPM